MKDLLKKIGAKLAPKKNVLVGYIVGAVIFGIIHILSALGVDLNPDQTTKLAVGAPIVVAHVWDSIFEAGATS
jgi:hypothetical protein